MNYKGREITTRIAIRDEGDPEECYELRINDFPKGFFYTADAAELAGMEIIDTWEWHSVLAKKERIR